MTPGPMGLKGPREGSMGLRSPEYGEKNRFKLDEELFFLKITLIWRGKPF